MLTQNTPYDSSKNDSNMICSSGNGRPAKLFTRKKRRLEYSKWAQSEQRKEHDARKLNSKQYFLSGIPSNLHICDEPGRYKEKTNRRHQHDNKNKIDHSEDKPTQRIALASCPI